MSDWKITKQSETYKEAAVATETIQEPAVGFIKPSDVGTGNVTLLSAIIKQNNFLIQLSVKQAERVEDLYEKLLKIQSKLDQGTSSEFEDSLKDLTARLEAINLGEKPKPVEKKKGPFYVYEDPLKIFNKEKSKIKK